MTGARFADVLDDALRHAGEAAARPRETGPFVPPPRDPFLFFRLPAPDRGGSSAARGPVGTAPTGERPRWVRTLTGMQRHALEALNALGARLSPDFNLQELRAEYRRLALGLHPDRHPGGSAHDHARLALAFGEATRHYRLLIALVR